MEINNIEATLFHCYQALASGSSNMREITSILQNLYSNPNSLYIIF